MDGYPKEMKITPEMVGLKIKVMNCAHGDELNHFTVNVKIMQLSDEGLDVFECKEEDCRA